jgi:hypothetical protein
LRQGRSFLTSGAGGVALWLLAAVSPASLILSCSAQEVARTPSQAVTERRALDPLTVDEQGEAVRIARADARVREVLGEAGVRVVSVTPVLLKTESPEKTDIVQRQVEVVLFRPQGEVGARVVVNLRQNAVAAVTRLNSDQVPFTNDDLNDAFELALKDAEVLKALGPSAQSFRPRTGPPGATAPENSVGGLPVRSPDPNDPCSKHRCLRLTFRRGNDYLSQPIVTVDLTAKHVYVEHRNPDRKAEH